MRLQPPTSSLQPPTSLMHIVHAQPDEMPVVRELFREYAESVSYNLCFQNFEEELRTLPGKYAPPAGCILLAKEPTGVAGGCVALRPLDTPFCEMKRLWIRPAHRGKRVGRLLVETLLAEAARRGYAAIRLDTLPSMTSAIRLYESLGFVPIAPYVYNPVPGARFLELRLPAAAAQASTT